MIDYDAALVANSYASGNVTVYSDRQTHQVDAGGFVGTIGAGEINRCYYCNYRNPQQSNGGTYQTETAMKQQSTFVGWNFSEIWAISPSVNNGFPFYDEITRRGNH